MYTMRQKKQEDIVFFEQKNIVPAENNTPESGRGMKKREDKKRGSREMRGTLPPQGGGELEA